GGTIGKLKALQLVGLAVAIQTRELAHVPSIDLRQSKTELFLKRLLEHRKISVFAKNEREHQPVIPRADLTVAAVISGKCAPAPGRNIGRRPPVSAGAVAEIGGCVADVLSGKQPSLRYGFDGLADQNSVHRDWIARRKILRDQLVLCRNVRSQGVDFARNSNLFALAQRPERHENVVVRIEFQDVAWHR